MFDFGRRPQFGWREVGGHPQLCLQGSNFGAGTDRETTKDWTGKLLRVLERVTQHLVLGRGSRSYTGDGAVPALFRTEEPHPMFRADPFFPTLARGGDAGGGAGPGAAGGAGATRCGTAPGPRAPPAPLRDAPGRPEPPSAPVIPPRESDTGAKQRPSRAAG